MPVIDSHHHLWDTTSSRFHYPWMTDDLAAIRGRFGPAELGPLLAETGVDGTILVQCLHDLDETEWYLETAVANPFIAGVVGWVDLTDADVAERLARLRERPDGHTLVGIRHMAQDEAPDWLARPEVQRGVAEVGHAGLTYDVLVRPHQLPAALTLARNLPDTRFVIDHIAKPDIKARELEPWASRMRPFAELPNTWVKVSGMIEEADWQAWHPADLRPYVDRVLDWFGPERLLFGSNWPVCLVAGSYAQVHDALSEVLSGLTDGERDRIFGGSAGRLPARPLSVRLASRLDGLDVEGALEVAARARALEASGREVIHFEIGEPDFDTPPNVREVTKRALDAGATHYAPYPGIPELRAAIAEDANLRKGLAVDPDRVFVTVGGKGVLFYAVMALVDPGDEVIVPDPGYPMYASVTRFAGGNPVPIRLSEDFRLDPDELAARITPRTRLIVVNSPANPTGAVLSRGDLLQIARVAIEHDLVVIADEIYGRILYQGEHVSIASLPGMAERTIILDGLSKAHAMTGWRMGYAIVPEPLRTGFGRMIMNSISCAPTFVQVGAVEALTGPQDAVDAMVAEFRARRDLMVAGLRSIAGVRCHEPQGAFYVFPDVSGTGFTGVELAARLLGEAGIATLPGTAFGEVATHHLRLSYANSRENIAKALERIGTFLRDAAPAASARSG